MMKVEVINTGSELLLGSVVNTHLKYFAETLFPLGLRIERQVTVPDGEVIREALLESFARADVVLVTGGLGPTTDDITREITAQLLELPLEHDPDVMTAISERFARHGLVMGTRVGRQAMRPAEAVVLPNHNGTAPGLYLAPRAAPTGAPRPITPHLFLLPGPPRELKPMFSESVLPILRGVMPAEAAAGMRLYRVSGVGESAVEELVGEQILALGIELGYCARPGEVDVRTIGPAALLEEAERIITGRLAAHIVSLDGSALEKVIVDLLTARGETLAVAESCTGGLLANRITNVPGASAIFLAGYVTYANEAKSRTLGVDAALIEAHGAVSGEVAAAMADGALQTSGASYALSTTGIAGPGGGSEHKPVGTVYIAFAAAGETTRVERRNFPTDRETFKFLATQAALDLMRRHVTRARRGNMSRTGLSRLCCHWRSARDMWVRSQSERRSAKASR
jgi:nicotinamide-nucleotide amidase